MDLKFGVAFNMKTPIANGGAPNARSDGGVRPIIGKLSSRGTHRAIKHHQKSFPLDVRAGSVLGGGRALNVNFANFGTGCLPREDPPTSHIEVSTRIFIDMRSGDLRLTKLAMAL